MMYNELQQRWLKSIKSSDGDFYTGVIDLVQNKVHEGNVFIVSKIFTSVANDGYADLRIKTGANKDAHAEIFISTEGKAYAYSYSGTTYTVDGTQLTAINRNSNFTGGNETIAYHTPTINVLGTQRFEQMMGGGVGVGNQLAGSLSERLETVHKVNSDILIRVQNKAGTAKDISMYVVWYEED